MLSRVGIQTPPSFILISLVITPRPGSIGQWGQNKAVFYTVQTGHMRLCLQSKNPQHLILSRHRRRAPPTARELLKWAPEIGESKRDGSLRLYVKSLGVLICFTGTLLSLFNNSSLSHSLVSLYLSQTSVTHSFQCLQLTLKSLPLFHVHIYSVHLIIFQLSLFLSFYISLSLYLVPPIVFQTLPFSSLLLHSLPYVLSTVFYLLPNVQ